MNTKTNEGVLYPPAERLIEAVKKMCARVLYHKGTMTLLGDAAVKAETELFEALAAMLGQDRTALFHEIGAMAQDIQCDLVAKAKDEESVDTALTADLNRQMNEMEKELAQRSPLSFVSVAPTSL